MENRFLEEVLPLLNLDADAGAAVDWRHGDYLPSHLPVGELAAGAVAAAALTGRWIQPARHIKIDPARVAVSFASEQYFSVAGVRPSVFAPLSGFFETADGWVRTHANYPHHREALERALGLRPEASAEDMREALSLRSSQEVEDDAFAAGALAVRVRTAQEWLETVQAAAVESVPLVDCAQAAGAADAPPVEIPERPRVLDLTRVISGPVASRTLAHLGCDVLRVDSPRLPEIPWQYLDTSGAKRSVLLDLRVGSHLARLHELLDEADVILCGYRPDALAAYGLDAASVREEHPGVVHASLTAWTPSGPWADRRGFDSLVQAATGISFLESGDGVSPGVLPAQALDHATGYLLAAGIACALARRRDQGGSWQVTAHLARTAHWLLRTPRLGSATDKPAEDTRHLQVTRASVGELMHARPAFVVEGRDEFADFGQPWGASVPSWL